MQDANKEHIKYKLATSFRKILKHKKKISLRNKKKNIEDLTLVDSLRQLEADSGLSYTLIQTVCTGKRDIQFTSLISLIESLGLSLSEFARIYDKVTEEHIKIEQEEIVKNKRKNF